MTLDGYLSGTPTAEGSWDLTVRATNGIGPEYEATFAFTAAPLPVFRLQGPDRYATAAAISRDTFGPRRPNVLIASGRTFPDALAGGALGGSHYCFCPVLLVPGASIPPVVADELRRLNPYRITVLGGTSAVSDAVASLLVQYASTGEVSRVSGADRYATAAAISTRFFVHRPDRAYIASGETFPDALTAAAAAGAYNGPLLLVRSSSIPEAVIAELQRLEPLSIYLVGGTASISPTVESALRAYAPSVTRLAGADRYQTAIEVSQGSFPYGATRLYVATGRNFPDALAGAAAAGIHDSPLLLLPGSVPANASEEVIRLAPDAAYILGGSAVVGSYVEPWLRERVAR
jgi:putative cell wall-binding protein